jgi:Rieske Fe-S protein
VTSGISAPTRRSVLTGTALAAVAGLAGFLFARNSAAAVPQADAAANGYGPAAAQGKELAALAEVPLGGGVVLGSVGVVLTRDSHGALHAFSATCTHQGCTVGSVQGGRILCPCHGSAFDAGTGAVVAGPAPAPLPKVPVLVRDATVYAA